MAFAGLITHAGRERLLISDTFGESEGRGCNLRTIDLSRHCHRWHVTRPAPSNLLFFKAQCSGVLGAESCQPRLLLDIFNNLRGNWGTQ